MFVRVGDGPLLESRGAVERTIVLGIASGAMPERDLVARRRGGRPAPDAVRARSRPRRAARAGGLERGPVPAAHRRAAPRGPRPQPPDARSWRRWGRRRVRGAARDRAHRSQPDARASRCVAVRGAGERLASAGRSGAARAAGWACADSRCRSRPSARTTCRMRCSAAHRGDAARRRARLRSAGRRLRGRGRRPGERGSRSAARARSRSSSATSIVFTSCALCAAAARAAVLIACDAAADPEGTRIRAMRFQVALNGAAVVFVRVARLRRQSAGPPSPVRAHRAGFRRRRRERSSHVARVVRAVQRPRRSALHAARAAAPRASGTLAAVRGGSAASPRRSRLDPARVPHCTRGCAAPHACRRRLDRAASSMHLGRRASRPDSPSRFGTLAPWALRGGASANVAAAADRASR
jgi:hypothetical protein